MAHEAMRWAKITQEWMELEERGPRTEAGVQSQRPCETNTIQT